MVELTLILAGLLCAATAAGIAAYLWMRSSSPTNRRARRRSRIRVDDVRSRLNELIDRMPRRRSLTHTSFPATEVAGAVEAWLLQDRPKNALVAAMHAVKTDPDDGEAYIHLARALFHCDEVDAAFRALSRAKSLAKDTPAVSYLEARIRLHSAGLGSGRDEVRDPAEALSILDLLLSALEHDPAFGEAAYHAAVLALSLGLKEEGRRLLRQVAPLMEASPERARYIEDVSRLN